MAGGEDDPKSRRPRMSTRPPAARGSSRPPPARLSETALRLSSIDFELVNASRRILENALGVVRGEQVVIVVDEARRDIGTSLGDLAETLGATAFVFELEQLGARPLRQLPARIAEAFASAQASVFMATVDDSEAASRVQL